jgi:hypothetical protein
MGIPMKRSVKNRLILLLGILSAFGPLSAMAKSFPSSAQIMVKGKASAAEERVYESRWVETRRRGLLGLAIDTVAGHEGRGSLEQMSQVAEPSPGVDCMNALKSWASAFANQFPQVVQGKKIVLSVYDDHRGLCDKNSSDNMSCGDYLRRSLATTFDYDAKFAAEIRSDGACVTPDWNQAAKSLGKYRALTSQVITPSREIEERGDKNLQAEAFGEGREVTPSEIDAAK